MEHVVDLSRLQFAITALYHFLFVPLTLGLAFIIAIIESIYYISGQQIWRGMAQFWGKLFAINFAMGVATGITMEFQFGTNWAYFSHYVGDIFGLPLAIEGLMAFFLESTFVGLFLFGWNKISKGAHLLATWCMAIGANFSALWILIANAWMQHPVGAKFNPQTMRMELDSIAEVFFNPVAQAKFVHTVSAGYVTGSIFVLSISSLYLLRKKCVEVAKRSIIVALSFGLFSSVSVIVLGDESGYLANETQKLKIALIEGAWETEKPPASFTLFGWPDQKNLQTKYSIKIPYVMGVIATRSLDKEVLGIKDLVQISKQKMRDGIQDYERLMRLKAGKSPNRDEDIAYLEKNYRQLGYALLLKRYYSDLSNLTDEQIEEVAWKNIPQVLPIFFAFRIMVGCGFYFLALFAAGFYLVNIKRNFHNKLFLRLALYSMPLPWIASQMGWIVAEYGRQPWVIQGILPTFLGVSSVNTTQVVVSLVMFVILYTTLLCIDIFLMIKSIKLGPEIFIHKEKDNA
ncbi:Cytochrome ubiquinol oxidase subunit 1 [Rickettsiales endosymbiont of Paramecium tredecaurelia]|uniref:cytochrome ubiquinol oxidase subunit I n=1 Tax=Candidatus Sarmatiella mevalonica TaxID=2770581 RepID=UPI001921D808|nr:cytochrome ubiquinol oxidase subunit I [Candidatus Sarmatiella mevalonica]MBL3284847.1 Cytochrome ubiquinol oxidase subunit 1 [Candidatus Sarmatiella mevalonica]